MTKTNELSSYVNRDFGDVRGISVDGTPYLVAKDVVTILGYSNASDAINTHVDDDDKIFINSKTQSDFAIEFEYKELGQRGGWLINESGFYSLVFGSKLKSAKKFKKWVTSEVLPQIRMTGGYIPIGEDEPNEVFLARAVKVANSTIEKKDEIIELQKRRIENLEVTEKNWKLLMDTKGTFCINDIAHFIGIGEYKLFELLRNFKVLFFNENGDNVPYENPQNKKYMITVAAIAPDGSAHSQTRVYPEGIAYITKILRKHGILEVSA